MARTTAWMPLYIGDYLADTRHLGAAEHGAYLLLIMQYWTSGPLLDDDATLARVASCTPDEWARIGPVVRQFFKAKGGKLHHKRIEAERDRAENVRKKRVISGQKGGTSKAAKAQADQGLASTCQDFARDLPGVLPDTATTTVESTSSSSLSDSGTRARPASRDAPSEQPRAAREPTPAMPAVTDPAHRWAFLADGEEIDDRMVRRPVCGGWFLDIVCQDIAKAIGVSDPRWRIDWWPVVHWLRDGLNPNKTILPAIRDVMARPNRPEQIRSLAYFDQAVRNYRRAA